MERKLVSQLRNRDPDRRSSCRLAEGRPRSGAGRRPGPACRGAPSGLSPPGPARRPAVRDARSSRISGTGARASIDPVERKLVSQPRNRDPDRRSSCRLAEGRPRTGAGRRSGPACRVAPSGLSPPGPARRPAVRDARSSRISGTGARASHDPDRRDVAPRILHPRSPLPGARTRLESSTASHARRLGGVGAGRAAAGSRFLCDACRFAGTRVRDDRSSRISGAGARASHDPDRLPARTSRRLEGAGPGRVQTRSGLSHSRRLKAPTARPSRSPRPLCPPPDAAAASGW